MFWARLEPSALTHSRWSQFFPELPVSISWTSVAEISDLMSGLITCGMSLKKLPELVNGRHYCYTQYSLHAT
jgi:hypothetical protein